MREESIICVFPNKNPDISVASVLDPANAAPQCEDNDAAIISASEVIVPSGRTIALKNPYADEVNINVFWPTTAQS